MGNKENNIKGNNGIGNAIIAKIKNIAIEKLGSNGYQTKLAELTGLKQSNISRTFSGEYSPKLSTLSLITDALGISLLKGSYNPKFPAFVWGDAMTTHPDHEWLIHWHEPKVMFGVPHGVLINDFETWRNEIIFDSPYPIDEEILNLLKIEAWNFLRREEAKTNNDKEDFEDDF